MRNIAVIPARGGSKRLKDKNIKPLLGIPLIGYSINEALSCDKIDAVYISTDCDKIKECIRDLYPEVDKVKIMDRPEELAEDHTTTAAVLKHVAEELSLNLEDNVVLLQPTNPLRPSNLIESCLELFEKETLDSLFSVSENHHKLGEIIENQFYPYNYTFGQRSQDMKKLYYENGLIYITKARLLLKEIIFDNNSYPYQIDKNFPIVDIDYLEDFEYADFLLRSKLYSQK